MESRNDQINKLKMKENVDPSIISLSKTMGMTTIAGTTQLTKGGMMVPLESVVNDLELIRESLLNALHRSDDSNEQMRSQIQDMDGEDPSRA